MTNPVSGAPLQDLTGIVWILSMNADGSVKSHQEISGTSGPLKGLLSGGDRFAHSLTNWVNGIMDLAVGFPFGDDGTQDAGAIFILFLKNNYYLIDILTIYYTQVTIMTA